MKTFTTAILWISLLGALVSSTFAFAGESEEQRKYSLTELTPAMEKLLTHGDRIDAFTTEMHDTFEYTDIYLDTPDWKLLKNNLSMRLRRRIFTEEGKKMVEYGFQLKSEMETAGAVRMEVEDDQMEIYQIAGKSLDAALAPLFDAAADLSRGPLSESPEMRALSAELTAWCARRGGAALAPFQELRFIFGAPLANLQPVVVGRSIRARSHIFHDQPGSSSPVWVMEASLDRARFIPALKSPEGAPSAASIFELEVENKDKVASEGTALMDQLEVRLKKDFGLQPGIDSKYRQSVRQLYGNLR